MTDKVLDNFEMQIEKEAGKLARHFYTLRLKGDFVNTNFLVK